MYRKDAIVFNDEGNIEFDGRPEKGSGNAKYVDTAYSKKRYGKTISCVGRFYNDHGINKAKRYIRKHS